MKIFSAEQLKEADRLTMEKQNISSDELMERAGKQIFNVIHHRTKENKLPIKIFCGVGNNGGDGLVVARLLLEHGYEVGIYIVNYSDKRSKDFLLNYDRVKNVTNDWPILLKSEADFPELGAGDFVLDAIFGIGLNRPLENWVASLIKFINESGAFILSIDMPSGLFGNEVTKEKESIIKADHTLTFQSPKLVFFLPETSSFAGSVKVLDIGLDKEFLSTTKTAFQLVTKQGALGYYKPREKFSHKGTFGHVLIVGGSYGKIGSVCLGATASFRAGAGLVTLFVPKCGYQIVQSVLPEAMAITDEGTNSITDIRIDFDPSVICFGVGVGQKQETLLAFEELLERTVKPMVIDADGLNLLSKNQELLQKLPKNSILTPHPRELERLIGTWKNDFEKLDKAREFVAEHGIILVIKGANTLTVSNEGFYVNSTGNPGMATAGSGDVLAGIITGLISQQYDPLAAAIFGVYLHGRAGDIAANKLSFQGMMASDISKNLGAAYLDLFAEASDKHESEKKSPAKQ